MVITMDLHKTGVRLHETVRKGRAQAMADGEVIVPDTKPDILKILQVDAEAVITDKNIENGRLVISGMVGYKVLYVPETEGHKIKSIAATMDFRQTVDAGDAPDDCEIFADASVGRVEFNTVNSRKMRLRAIIDIDYEIYKAAEHEICTGVGDDGVETMTRSMKLEDVINVSGHEFTVKERLEIPSGQSRIAEILKADARISDTEYKTVTGKIIIKGCVEVCVLYTDDDGEILFTESELPFTEVLDASGVGEDTVCDIDYRIINVMCEAEPDRDGDMRVVAMDIDIHADVCGTDIKELEVLTDCFVPYKKTECRKERIDLLQTVCRPTAQNTIREILDFPGDAPKVSGVYNVITDAVVTRSELRGNRLLCEGRLEAYILYLTDTADNPVYSIKKDIPFSYMIDCPEADGTENIELKSEVNHVSYNLNSSGALELRCLLDIECKLTKLQKLYNICGIETNDKTGRRGIVIYFTAEGDSLWEIAKRYAVPMGKIAKYNQIDTVEPGTKLFIPA